MSPTKAPGMPEGLPLVLGNDVTVAHGAILHACTIGDRCLVGMGAIVMDGAVLESDCDGCRRGGRHTRNACAFRYFMAWQSRPGMRATSRTLKCSNQAYNARHYVRLKDLYREGGIDSGRPGWPLACSPAIGLALMAGFPVAFTLAGVALLFAGLGVMAGTFDAGVSGSLSQPHLRHHDQRDPDRRPGLRVHGCDAGAVETGRPVTAVPGANHARRTPAAWV